MNAEMREIINNLTEDIITQFGIKIPIDNIDDVNEDNEAHVADLAGNNAAGGGEYYQQQFQSDFPYIQYNFSPRNIGKENILRPRLVL